MISDLLNQEAPCFSCTAYIKNTSKDKCTCEFTTVDKKTLQDRKRWSILFFYPADFTFVCPTEIAYLSHKKDDLENANIDVYAISTDSEFVHKSWYETEPLLKDVYFHVLADKNHRMSRAYGVLNEDTGLAYRATFILDPKLKIRSIECNENAVGRNIEDIIRTVYAAQHADKYGEVCQANWNKGDKGIQIK